MGMPAIVMKNASTTMRRMVFIGLSLSVDLVKVSYHEVVVLVSPEPKARNHSFLLDDFHSSRADGVLVPDFSVLASRDFAHDHGVAIPFLGAVWFDVSRNLLTQRASPN